MQSAACLFTGPAGSLYTLNVQSVYVPDENDIGSRAVYSCVPGFRPADPAFAICSRDGSWAPLPRCVPGKYSQRIRLKPSSSFLSRKFNNKGTLVETFLGSCHLIDVPIGVCLIS